MSSVDVVVSIVDFSDGLTEDNLLELFNFDSDFTLQNGDDYLWKEAEDEGYSTNVAYLFANSDSVEDALNLFLEKSRGYWVSPNLQRRDDLVILGIASEG